MNSIRDDAPKALTVKQPWAWALIHGGKDIENRSRPTRHRGRLYIHAGKSVASEALDFPPMQWALGKSTPELPAGFVLGTVDVVGCHHASVCQTRDDVDNHIEGRYTGVLCSEWAMEDHYHWILANPQPVTPFPAQGKLGIWKLATL